MPTAIILNTIFLKINACSILRILLESFFENCTREENLYNDQREMFLMFKIFHLLKRLKSGNRSEVYSHSALLFVQNTVIKGNKRTLNLINLIETFYAKYFFFNVLLLYL